MTKKRLYTKILVRKAAAGGSYLGMIFLRYRMFFFGKGTEIHEIPPYKIDRIFFVRGSFRANKGSKRSYAITAFQKKQGVPKNMYF